MIITFGAVQAIGGSDNTVSVIRKFPFRLSFTIVERSLNDRETVHVRSAYDRNVVFVYTHADIIFRIHSRPKHEKV